MLLQVQGCSGERRPGLALEGTGVAAWSQSVRPAQPCSTISPLFMCRTHDFCTRSRTGVREGVHETLLAIPHPDPRLHPQTDQATASSGDPGDVLEQTLLRKSTTRSSCSGRRTVCALLNCRSAGGAVQLIACSVVRSGYCDHETPAPTAACAHTLYSQIAGLHDSDSDATAM